MRRVQPCPNSFLLQGSVTRIMNHGIKIFLVWKPKLNNRPLQEPLSGYACADAIKWGANPDNCTPSVEEDRITS